MSLRPVRHIIQSKPTIKGAGVHLRRAFGFGNTSDFDPFLLLNDFRGDRPEDYLAGFLWYGPIVMNTREELRLAFEELQQGTFLRPDS